MNLNKKIGFLLDRGLNPQFISTLNEGKINLLFEKMSRKETTEQTTTPPNTTPVTKTGYVVKDNSKTTIGNMEVDTTGGKTTITPMESEIKEKFESKAQQGLFWARCNKCKDDDCKWCQMAKEFDEKTSKKDYKNMPEKKHPEKTVKYKKKETNEVVDYNKALTAAMVGGMKSNMNSLLNPKLTSESKLRNHLENIIEKNLKPTMTKRDLIRLIERTMGDTETAPSETETEEKKKKKKKSPFERPDNDPAEAKRKGEQKEGLDYFMSQVKKHRLI